MLREIGSGIARILFTAGRPESRRSDAPAAGKGVDTLSTPAPILGSILGFTRYRRAKISRNSLIILVSPGGFVAIPTIIARTLAKVA